MRKGFVTSKCFRREELKRGDSQTETDADFSFLVASNVLPVYIIWVVRTFSRLWCTPLLVCVCVWITGCLATPPISSVLSIVSVLRWSLLWSCICCRRCLLLLVSCGERADFPAGPVKKNELLKFTSIGFFSKSVSIKCCAIRTSESYASPPSSAMSRKCDFCSSVPWRPRRWRHISTSVHLLSYLLSHLAKHPPQTKGGVRFCLAPFLTFPICTASRDRCASIVRQQC